MPRERKNELDPLVCDCGNADQNRFFSVVSGDMSPQNRGKGATLIGWRCHDCGKVHPKIEGRS